MPTKRPRIYVTLTPEVYRQIKSLAKKNHSNNSDVARELIEKGLDLEVTQQNLDYMSIFLREQLTDVLRPFMDRMISLQSKTCIQAGAAAYLSAESIRRFVPPAEQMEVVEAYEAARKKAIEYTRRRIDLDSE